MQPGEAFFAHLVIPFLFVRTSSFLPHWLHQFILPPAITVPLKDSRVHTSVPFLLLPSTKASPHRSSDPTLAPGTYGKKLHL